MGNKIIFKLSGLSETIHDICVRAADKDDNTLLLDPAVSSASDGTITLTLPEGMGKAGEEALVFCDRYTSSNVPHKYAVTAATIEGAPIPKTFNFTFVYGQSLSGGDGGIPNVRNTAELAGLAPHVKLYAGVDTNGAGAAVTQYTAEDVATLKDYAEYDTYQSHGWGYYNYFKTKGLLEDGSQYLYAAVGVGARTIEELSTAPEFNNVPTVFNALPNVKPSELEFGDVHVHLSQGEADSTVPTPPEVWKKRIRDFVDFQLRPLVRSNTGGKDLFVYLPQLGKGNTHPLGGYNIANAQFELARDVDVINMPMAGWICNYLFGRDDYQPHLTSQGYDLQGEYIARAESLIRAGKRKVLPPHPVAFRVKDDHRTVEIDFDNSYGHPLTIDNSGTIVPAVPGAGFSVGDKDNSFIILPCTDVSLNGHTLTLKSPVLLEPGMELSAGRIDFNWPKNEAYRLPCINLRDTDPEVSPSTGVPMHNWGVQFIKTFEASENVFDDKTQNIWSDAVDPTFAVPMRSNAPASVTGAFGIGTYSRIYPNSTYLVTFTIEIVSGTFRLSVGSSSDGIRESFTQSGTYTREVTITSSNGLKADALGNDHDMTLVAMDVRLKPSAGPTQLILNHSQSLGIGDQGFPLTHDTAPLGTDVVMFSGLSPTGPGYEVALQDADLVDTVPFAEQTRETHAAGMLNWLKAEDALPANVLYASTGVGGKTISELTDVIPGQEWGIANVHKVIDRVKAMGDFEIPFTTWIHGEANSVNYADYMTDLRGYHDGIMARSGKTFPLIMDQTGKQSSISIAGVLLDYADANADAFLAGPKYWLNRLYPEAGNPSLRLHLNAEGYMLQGEMIAEAARQVLDGIDYKPVQPVAIRVVPGTNYKEVEIDWHVPNGGALVKDDVTLPLAPGLGIQARYYEPFGPKEPLEVIITGNTTRLVFDEPITTGASIIAGDSLDDRDVTDGIKLPCINLRSDVGHPSRYLEGFTWYDWAVQFKRPVLDGALDIETGNLWHYGDFTGVLGANEIGLGDSSDWIIEAAGDTTLTYDVTVTSGQIHIWVAGTRTIVSSSDIASVDIPAASQKRLYIQAGSGGFEGSVSISVNKRGVAPWSDPDTKVINSGATIPSGEVIS